MRNISRLLVSLALLLCASLPAAAQYYNIDGQGVWSTSTVDAHGGIAPVTTSAPASSLVLKNGAGNIYGLSIKSNSDGTAILIDASAAPSSGASVQPLGCYQVKASSTASAAYNPVAISFTNGAVLLFSSNPSCYTFTALNADFMSGQVR